MTINSNESVNVAENEEQQQQVEVVEEEEQNQEEEKKIFTVEILKEIKEAQQQHGLRHLDYQRYRSYCSRRLQRLRKTLNFQCRGNNTRRYLKREIDIQVCEDSKILLIPLFQAERAWAYAMQLKQEANTEPRKRFHLANLLRKAAKIAAELEKLSESERCDARTKLEAQGYNSLIQGQFCFEAHKWKESLAHFTVSKKIYEKLSAALKGDDSQIFYSVKVEEITPNIRYCNYNLGDESAKKDLIDMKFKTEAGSELAEKIDELISQTKEKQVTTFSEVVWLNGITLQIKNERVKTFLLNVQDYEKEIKSLDVTPDARILIYENISKEAVDAIQIVRDELKLDPHFQLIVRGQTVPVEDKVSNSLLLFSYLTWLRTKKTIERNLLMVESYKKALNENSAPSSSDNKIKNVKPQDIVRLYDIIIQNYKDLNNLTGLQTDGSYLRENEFFINFYMTYRAYYIYLFYMTNKKFAEAVGFCFKVKKYLDVVDKSFPSSASFDKSAFKADLAKLAAELNDSKYKLQTEAFLNDPSMIVEDTRSQDEKLAKIPLNQRLDTYFEDPNLLSGGQQQPNIVQVPLSYEPVPCKPLFFDLALNQIELPNYDDKIDVAKAKQQQQGTPQGVKGFFKSMLGFGGK